MRKMAKDALDTLGTLLDETAGRDAVHVAVEPVVAGVMLHPGQHVRIEDGKAVPGGKTYGVVDPYLTGTVYPGQRFWFFLYPRQITSLRHVWEHPLFSGEPEPSPAPAVNNKAASEAWLRKFIANSDCPDYETVIAKALHNDSWSKEYLHFDGEDAHGEIPAEFWDHLEVVSGRKIDPSERAEYFSCSC